VIVIEIVVRDCADAGVVQPQFVISVNFATSIQFSSRSTSAIDWVWIEFGVDWSESS